MKYIKYKHKPGKRGWYVFSATTARKFIKLIQIKEALNIQAHITQDAFSVQLLADNLFLGILCTTKLVTECFALLVETDNKQVV